MIEIITLVIYFSDDSGYTSLKISFIGIGEGWY